MRNSSIGVLFAAMLFAGVARADDQAAARAIVDEALKAHGGEAALSKFTGADLKVKGTAYEGDLKTPVAFEWFLEGNDKMRTVTFDEQGKIDAIEVVHGREGWSKHGEDAAEA